MVTGLVPALGGLPLAKLWPRSARGPSQQPSASVTTNRDTDGRLGGVDLPNQLATDGRLWAVELERNGCVSAVVDLVAVSAPRQR